MKSLSNYIYESRMKVNELPFDFELFNNFIKHSILEWEFDESEYWDEMKQKIESVRPGSMKWFKGYCEKYFALNKEGITIKQFYDSLKEVFTNRVDNVLGAGSFGIVININKNWVAKIWHEKEIPSPDKEFMEFCWRNSGKYSCFPVVKKIKRNFCIMEKLQINTPRIRQYVDIIEEKLFQGEIEDIELGKLSDFEKEVWNWALMAKKAMGEIGSTRIKWPGDFKLTNIGERKNGEIVYFDI